MRLKRLLMLFVIAVAGAASLVLMVRYRPVDVPEGERLATYDVAPYRAVLADVVHDGLVDYGRLDAEHAHRLAQYLDAVARCGPTAQPEVFPTRADRLAYFLNAYNALMLWKWREAGAARAGPGRSVNRFWFFFDVWKVDGAWVSLDALEQSVIRPTFRDPRIHFALVCGAMSCPELLAEPFEGARLDEQLDGLARSWLRAPDGLAVRADGSVWMSSVFSWYATDFEAMGGLPGVLNRFLAHDDPRRPAALAAARAGQIQFMPYDWSINAFTTPASAPSHRARPRSVERSRIPRPRGERCP